MSSVYRFYLTSLLFFFSFCMIRNLSFDLGIFNASFEREIPKLGMRRLRIGRLSP